MNWLMNSFQKTYKITKMQKKIYKKEMRCIYTC